MEDVLAEAVVAANKLLRNLLLNLERQDQKHPRRHRRNLAVEEEAVAALAGEAADLAFRPASTQSKFRPAARTLPERCAFRRIREYKSQKLTERSGRML